MTPSIVPTATAAAQSALGNTTTWIIFGGVCVALIIVSLIVSAYKRRKATNQASPYDPFAHMKQQSAPAAPADPSLANSDTQQPNENSSFAKYGRKAQENSEDQN